MSASDTFSEIQINWGDGSDPQSVAPGTPSATHTFTPGIDGAVIFASGIVSSQDAAWSNPELVNITGVNAPAAPTNLAASSSAIREMDVSWSAGSNDALSYTVQRSDDAGQTWNDVGSVYGGQTTYSDTGLDPATTYSYRVTAANDGGSSSASSSIVATTPDDNLHLSYYTDQNGQIVLTWSDPVVNGYELEEKNLDPSVNENFHLIATLGPNDISFTPAIGSNDHFAFRIRTDYSDGTVGNYSSVTYGPPQTPPSDPNDPTPTLNPPTNVYVVMEDGFPAAVIFDSGYGNGDSFDPYTAQSLMKAADDPYAVMSGAPATDPGAVKDDDGHWKTGLHYVSAGYGLSYSGPIRIINTQTGDVSPWSSPITVALPGTRADAPQLESHPLEDGNVQLTVSMSESMKIDVYLVPSGAPQEGIATLAYEGSLSSGQSITVAAGPPGSHFFAVGYSDDNPTAPSPYSNFVDATGNTATTKPAAPDAAWASYKTTSSQLKVTLAWHNTPDNEDGYKIERRKTGAGDDAWQPLNNTGADETTYTDTISASASNEPYKFDYRISAKNSAGSSTSYAYTSVAAPYGGPDITGNLLRIEQDIFTQYQTKFVTQAQKDNFAHAYFVDPGTNWEISSLFAHHVVTPSNTGVLPDGRYTVTVQGKVYPAEEVNYFVYGVWARIVSQSGVWGESLVREPFAKEIIAYYRIKLWHGQGIPGRQAWFAAGYHGDLNIASPTAIPEVLPGQIYDKPVDYYLGSRDPWRIVGSK